MLLARIISLACPVTEFILLLSLLWRPDGFYSVTFIVIMLTVLNLWLLYKLAQQEKHLQEMFFYIITGFLLNISSLAVLVLLENFWFKLAIILLTFFVLFDYFNHLFSYFFKKTISEKEKEIFNFKFAEIIVLFFISAGFFGFVDFLRFSKFLALAAVFAVVWLLSRLNEFFNFRIQAKKSHSFHLLSALIFMEFFWAVLSFPFIYYIKATLWSLIYLFFSFYRDKSYQNELNKKAFKANLIIIILILIGVLLTARWF